MEKRIFIAVVISIAFLWLWAAVAPKVFPNLIKPKTTVTTPTPKPANTNNKTTATTTTTKPTTAAAPVTAQRASAAPPVSVKPTSAATLEFTSIDAPEYVARFSNRGAVLVSFQLKNYKTKDGSPVELVKARDLSRTDFPFSIEGRDPALATR